MLDNRTVKRTSYRKINNKPKKTILWYLLLAGSILLIFFAANRYVSYANGDATSVTKTDGSTTSSASTTTTAQKTVCLDPGHGGDDDPGATNDSVVERDINLTVINKIGTLLKSAGYRVVYTKTTADEVLTNTERAAVCNNAKADILVSVHHNDYTDSVTDYSTVLYYKDSDKKLANTLLDTVSDDLNVTNNGLTTLEDNMLVKSNMPSALVEAFFVSSDYEAGLITADNSTRLEDEASAIAEGIESYFANNN